MLLPERLNMVALIQIAPHRLTSRQLAELKGLLRLCLKDLDKRKEVL